MLTCRDEFAIVMRTFWPVSAVVGEGMMQVAETLAKNSKCRVITQEQESLKTAMAEYTRGLHVDFSLVYAFSNSSSKILVRILDLLWFTCSVLCVLVYRRPKIIYVATDPPLLVPMIVAIYSKLFGAKYIYHIQDIHPEASSIVYPILRSKLLLPIFYLLRWIDGVVSINAAKIITLTPQMADSLRSRYKSKTLSVIYLDNPAAVPKKSVLKQFDFCFVGNAGRLQRIPLVVESIRQYLLDGGKGNFAFAGGGVMAHLLKRLADEFPKNFFYFGKVSVEEATNITNRSHWALLPIDDEVCSYAFPSKASTYVVSGINILAICSEHTSVSQWIKSNMLGVVVVPTVTSIKQAFTKLGSANNGSYSNNYLEVPERNVLKSKLSTDFFVSKMVNIIKGVN